MFQMKDHDEGLLLRELSLSAECRENRSGGRTLTDCGPCSVGSWPELRKGLQLMWKEGVRVRR